jgi:hypothetical protein
MKDGVVAPKAKQPLPATDTARSNRAGIVAMLRAMAAFSVSDTCVKLATVQLPTSEIMVLRGVIATALVSALIIFNGQIRAPEGLLRPVVAL